MPPTVGGGTLDRTTAVGERIWSRRSNGARGKPLPWGGADWSAAVLLLVVARHRCVRRQYSTMDPDPGVSLLLLQRAPLVQERDTISAKGAEVLSLGLVPGKGPRREGPSPRIHADRRGVRSLNAYGSAEGTSRAPYPLAIAPARCPPSQRDTTQVVYKGVTIQRKIL